MSVARSFEVFCACCTCARIACVNARAPTAAAPKMTRRKGRAGTLTPGSKLSARSVLRQLLIELKRFIGISQNHFSNDVRTQLILVGPATLRGSIQKLQ